MEKIAVMKDTNGSYDQAAQACRDIFIKKTRDYGTSWRVLRIISIADQLYIKARRIRTLQETKEQKVGEDKAGEFRAMVNYGIIGLIQLSLGGGDAEGSFERGQQQVIDRAEAEAEKWYDEKITQARSVMLDKNHDYGEAWREISQESFTDLILMKILRIRQITANEGKTLISEGIDSNFIDIINYSLFALILIAEGRHAA